MPPAPKGTPKPMRRGASGKIHLGFVGKLLAWALPTGCLADTMAIGSATYSSCLLGRIATLTWGKGWRTAATPGGVALRCSLANAACGAPKLPTCRSAEEASRFALRTALEVENEA